MNSIMVIIVEIPTTTWVDIMVATDMTTKVSWPAAAFVFEGRFDGAGVVTIVVCVLHTVAVIDSWGCNSCAFFF